MFCYILDNQLYAKCFERLLFIMMYVHINGTEVCFPKAYHAGGVAKDQRHFSFLCEWKIMHLNFMYHTILFVIISKFLTFV